MTYEHRNGVYTAEAMEEQLKNDLYPKTDGMTTRELFLELFAPKNAADPDLNSKERMFSGASVLEWIDRAHREGRRQGLGEAAQVADSLSNKSLPNALLGSFIGLDAVIAAEIIAKEIRAKLEKEGKK
jgi:hypothetical protein